MWLCLWEWYCQFISHACLCIATDMACETVRILLQLCRPPCPIIHICTIYSHPYLPPHTYHTQSHLPQRTCSHPHTHMYPHNHRTHWYKQVTVAGMLSLAYSPETHWYLAKPHIIEGVIETCDIQRTNYQVSADERVLECLLLKYVSLVSAMCIALIQSYWLYLLFQLHTK